MTRADVRLTPDLSSGFWLGLLLFVAGWLVLCLPDPISFAMDPDWGHQLAGADQILRYHQHPFIDWRSTYGPLTFYASAVGQALGGQRVVGEMALVVLGFAAGYVLLARLVARATGRIDLALLVTVLALLALPRLYKYYLVLCPALVLTAAWFAIEWPGRRSTWLLGLTIAVAGLFRPDTGAAAVLAGSLAVGMGPAAGPAERARRVLALLLATGVCAAPWLLWAAAWGGLDDYLRDTLVGAPLHAEGFALPFPQPALSGGALLSRNITFALYVGFFLLPLVSAVTLVRQWRRLPPTLARQIAVSTLLAAGCLIQAAHRADFSHLLQAIPPSFLVVGWLAGVALSPASPTSAPRAGLRQGVTLAALLALGALLDYTLTSSPQAPRLDVAHLAKVPAYLQERAALIDAASALAPDNAFLGAVRYVRVCTRPGAYIEVLPTFTSLYYLAERPFGGGQMLLAPGFFTRDDDQQRMIERMRQDPVVLVVIASDLAFDNLETRRVANFAPLVQAYLDEAFEQVAQFGDLRVLALRGPRDSLNPVCG